MYVLTTPVRDELPRLPRLLRVVEGQTARPLVWVVVDDGSRDGSRAWLEQAAASRPWMELIAAPRRSEGYLSNLGQIQRWGLERAFELAAPREVAFAGTLDADVTLPPEHYAAIGRAFEADPRLGVASSQLYVDGSPEPFRRADQPRGPTQTFRRACLEEIGGFPPHPSPDSITNVKARLRGWRCAVLPELIAELDRPTSGRYGELDGYRRLGRRTWFLGLHPIGVALRALGYTVAPPSARGLAFSAGWLGEALKRAPRCPDREVRAYYRTERPKELLRALRGAGPRYFRSGKRGR